MWDREDDAPVREVEFENSFSALPALGQALLSAAIELFGALGESKEVQDLRLAVQEAATNLIEHGSIADPTFHVRFERFDDDLWVHLVCRGNPYDPTVLRPTAPDPLELAEGGYGLYLMHTLTDGLLYQSDGEWNTLSMKKRVVALREAA